MKFAREKIVRNMLKRNRALGLLFSICVIACVILYFTGIINPWYCLIIESYMIGIIFLLNTSLQEIKHGKPLPIVNAVLGLLFFATAIFLISYGFTAGYLSVSF